jgi:lambda repressor-like predicted transcriptional regulator
VRLDPHGGIPANNSKNKKNLGAQKRIAAIETRGASLRQEEQQGGEATPTSELVRILDRFHANKNLFPI